MLHVVRHKLRVIIRLAALLVLLGLGTVPVECSAVYGPHSIFISAEAVAAVQHGSHQHPHGAAPAANDMAGMTMPDEHAATSEPGTPSPVTSRAEITSTLPMPAGTAVDALIAVALFEADDAPGPRDFVTVSRLLPLPTGNRMPAPEPPPPQPGS